ncbi:hypothetical protein BVI2075_320198 [Burkholderia vietnamiensis]|nr:hypothetical protein BVI2075_320198 [Burkholderia vietnamiensis]
MKVIFQKRSDVYLTIFALAAHEPLLWVIVIRDDSSMTMVDHLLNSAVQSFRENIE